MSHRQLEECDSDPPPDRTSNLNLVLKHDHAGELGLNLNEDLKNMVHYEALLLL